MDGYLAAREATNRLIIYSFNIYTDMHIGLWLKKKKKIAINTEVLEQNWFAYHLTFSDR